MGDRILLSSHLRLLYEMEKKTPTEIFHHVYPCMKGTVGIYSKPTVAHKERDIMKGRGSR